MKRLLNNIKDLLADASKLERAVDVKGTAEHRPATALPLLAKLERFFRSFSITMADAALLEIGVLSERPAGKQRSVLKALEENLIEVAFAEAADYDDIRKAILRERCPDQDITRPDECPYEDMLQTRSLKSL